MKISLGTVGHFALAVPDPDRSAKWWKHLFDLEEIFRYDGGVGLSNEHVTIVLQAGKARPEVIDHMSFHLPSMKSLNEALEFLRKERVELEDPGDEIGPEAPGSKNMGLWFHDPDGYRWELSVLSRA
ncbi:MAG TPA: VOC family protein [Candidatus Baltobacteraceae bacterium]|jgi:catechol 2,3-dioxygenase-like lactoylglutathione lyase family enzyme|nr:VOC family protein [Candidatus Baltobacteraceae bacterium]